MLKWDGIEWAFKAAVTGTETDLKPASTNSFKFVAQRDTNQNIISYTLEPDPQNSLKTAWTKCSALVYQGGLPLVKNVLIDDRLNPKAADFETKHKALVKAIKEEKLDDLPFVFERLVGTVPFNSRNHPVSFYQVAGCYKAKKKLLLIAIVDQSGASPTGVVSGNN